MTEVKGVERTVLNKILRRNINWIGHILRNNCLLHDAIGGQMTEMKGVGRRRTQLLDDLRNMRRYWELKGKLKIKTDGNDYQSNIRKSINLLITRILNNNNNNNKIIIIIILKIINNLFQINKKQHN